MATPRRGEVWLVDLGYVAKIRPCMVLSIAADAATDRALVCLIPHTTSTRASRFEVAIDTRFLKPGAFDAQNLVTVAHAKLVRRLGSLTTEQLQQVAEVVQIWLGFKSAASPS